MKMYSTHLKLILAASLMLQMGCNGNDRRNGQLYNQYGYGAYGSPQGGFQQPGNAFRQQNPLFNTVASNLANNGNMTSVIDQDGDGVTNSLDGCPNTPRGATVDARGCSPSASSKDDKTTKTSSKPSTSGTKTEPAEVSWDEVDDWQKFCANFEVSTETEGSDNDLDGISNACEDFLSNKEAIKNKLIAKIDDSLANTKDAEEIKKLTKAKSEAGVEADKYYMPGLHKDIFNGALVSTKFFQKEYDPTISIGFLSKKTDCQKAGYTWDQTLCLIDKSTKAKGATGGDDEKAKWKAYAASGGLSDAADSKLDRAIIQKFGARQKIWGEDMSGMRDMFSIEQQEFAKNDPNYKSFFLADQDFHKALDIAGLGSLNKDKFSFVKGGNQNIPFARNASGISVADLSGINMSTDSLKKDQGFLYAAETNLVLPPTGIELQIGQITNDDHVKVGKPAGIFMAIAGVETKILTTDMIAVRSVKSNRLENAPGCSSVHAALIYVADETSVKSMSDQAILSESIFYRVKNTDDWKPLPQQMMSIKARGGSDCKVLDKSYLFPEAKSILQQVVSKDGKIVNKVANPDPVIALSDEANDLIANDPTNVTKKQALLSRATEMKNSNVVNGKDLTDAQCSILESTINKLQ